MHSLESTRIEIEEQEHTRTSMEPVSHESDLSYTAEYHQSRAMQHLFRQWTATHHGPSPGHVLNGDIVRGSHVC